MNNEARRVLDSVLLGVVGALGAQLFMFSLKLTGSLTLSGLAGYQST